MFFWGLEKERQMYFLSCAQRLVFEVQAYRVGNYSIDHASFAIEQIEVSLAL